MRRGGAGEGCSEEGRGIVTRGRERLGKGEWRGGAREG